jgi:hypothetical protein
VVRWRAYLRHHERLVDNAAAHILHIQKALMQMKVQLHHIVTDITGVTVARWSYPTWHIAYYSLQHRHRWYHRFLPGGGIPASIALTGIAIA